MPEDNTHVFDKYFVQYQNLQWNTLSELPSGTLAVVDPDYTINDAPMSAGQMTELYARGIHPVAYLDIGEWEDYRPFLGSNHPSYVGSAVDEWDESFHVDVANEEWQSLIVSRAVALADEGYGGILLDVVDVGNPQEMADFIIRISEAVKAEHPDFMVIPNGGHAMFGMEGYAAAIDGAMNEDMYHGGTGVADPSEKAAFQSFMANNEGKFVLALDYPANEGQVESYMGEAYADGFMPFAADIALGENAYLPGMVNFWENNADNLGAWLQSAPASGAGKEACESTIQASIDRLEGVRDAFANIPFAGDVIADCVEEKVTLLQSLKESCTEASTDVNKVAGTGDGVGPSGGGVGRV